MARPLTITAFGDAQVDTAFSKSGGASLLLDGDPDYLEIDNSAGDLNITGAWTVEAWVRLPNSNIDHYIYSAGTAGSTNWIFSINFDSPGSAAVLLSIFDGLGNQGECDLVSATLTHSQFVHYAWTSNGSGTLRLWIDGVLAKTQTGNAYTNLVTTHPVTIGRYAALVGSGFDGHIDEFRVSDVERYTGTFTPSARHAPDGNTRLLLHFDGADASTTFTDDVGVQGSAGLNTAFAIIEADGRTFLRNTVELQIDTALAVQATDNPSMVFIRDDHVYTWDSTDTWDRIELLDSWFQGYRFPSVVFADQITARLLKLGSAELDSQFVVSAASLNLKIASAQLSLEFGTTADADNFKFGSAGLNTAFAIIEADGRTFLRNTVELETEFQSTVIAAVDVQGSSDMATEFAVDIVGRILKLAELELDNFATLLVSASVDIDGVATLDSQFAQQTRGGLLVQVDEPYDYTWDTIDPDTWQGFVIDRWEPNGLVLFETLTLTAVGAKILDAEAQLASQFDLQARGGRILDASSVSVPQFDLGVAADIIRGGASELSLAFDLAASADNFNIASADLDLEFSTDIAGGVILDAVAVLEGVIDFSVTADNFNIASATLSMSFALTAQPTLIPSILPFTLFSAITVSAEPTLTVGGAAVLDLFTAQLAVGERIRNAQAELSTEFDLSIETTVIVDGRSELSVFGFLVTDARLSDLRGSAVLGMAFGTVFVGDLRLLESELVYKILSEQRLITIDGESRILQVDTDTRLISVLSEHRRYEIIPETRTLDIEDLIA